MISAHLQAIRALEDNIKILANIANQLPDDLPKYQLIVRIELMQRTLQEYIAMSGRLYDQLMDFTITAAE